MVDSCNCSDEAGKASGEFSLTNEAKSVRATNICPVNGLKGKPVESQTIKALLKVSLRLVQNTDYFYCSTQDCSVVYFSSDGNQIFTVEELREKVYHKEPHNSDGLVCYCFQYTLGELQSSSSQQRQAIIADIKQGIFSEQCSCDLRNPQGSCCLGNVSKLVKQLDTKM